MKATDRRRRGSGWEPGARQPWERLGACLAAVVLAASSGGCEDLLTVDNPGNITEDELGHPAVVKALKNTAPAAVAEAYDRVTLYEAVTSDNLVTASTRADFIRLDRGDFRGVNEYYEEGYNLLVAASWRAVDARTRLEALVGDPSTDADVGRTWFWDAIARVTTADLFEGFTFDGGPLVPYLRVYEEALPLLTTAATIAQAAGDDTYAAAAHATMARVHRSLFFETGDPGHLEAAATEAGRALAIRPDFRVVAEYETPGRENLVYTGTGETLGHNTTSDRMIGRKDPVTGQRDPRIQHGPYAGKGAFGDRYFLQRKYPSRNADIPVSRWQEAQLILAEYRLAAGDLAGAVEAINAVRAGAGLPPFESADPDAIRARLVAEREVEFWLELRRWTDHRYYGIYPERWVDESRALGLDRRWPISFRERSTNPNLGR